MKSLLFTCPEEAAFNSLQQKLVYPAHVVMINYLTKFGVRKELFFHLKWKGPIRTQAGEEKRGGEAAPAGMW